MNPPIRKSSSPLSLLLLAIALAGVTGSSLYYVIVHLPAAEARARSQQVMSKIVGLSDVPITRRLDPLYADADGDFIADPPTDPAHFADPETLRFCWIPDDDTAAHRAEFASLLEQIARATGRKVEYATDIATPDDQLRALRDGKLHVCALSTGAVPIGVDRAGFVPTAMPASASGNAKYQMLLIVPASSPARDPADLRGREIALTEPTSNSGYRAPVVLLKTEHGLLPERDYRIRATGGYEHSIAGIADGRYDAAAVASDVLSRAVAANRIAKDKYRVILVSPDFPPAAIGLAHNLTPDLAARIKSALLAFEFAGTTLQPRFAPSQQARFIPIDYRNDWALVRAIDASLERPQIIGLGGRP